MTCFYFYIRRMLFILLFLSSCMGLSGGPLDETWYLEGYITNGTAGTIGTINRIHGTVKFTNEEIQFSTNIGDFTRKASMAGMEYVDSKKEYFTYMDWSSDPPVEKEFEIIVENTKVKVISVDESTLIMKYGKAGNKDLNSGNTFQFYKWMGVVLTKQPVSSRQFPFNHQSVQLWLQPDVYDGISVGFEATSEARNENAGYLTHYIEEIQHSGQLTIGGSEAEGFSVAWNNERMNFNILPNLNELINESTDADRKRVHYWVSEEDNAIHEIYSLVSWEASRALHLGDGRMFWFSANAGLDEEFEDGVSLFGQYIGYAEMGCGVLEQKLWFNASFSQQAASKASAPLQVGGVLGMKASAVPRPCVALVKQIRGEVNEVYGGVRKKVSVGDWVRKGSQIETSAKSFVQLVFLDRSLMNVGPNSQMKVKEFTPKESGFIDLVKGKIRTQVTKDYLQMKNSEKSKVFLKTKNAVFGVRGTEFEISYSEVNEIGTTQLQMIEGSVEFTNLDTGVTTLVANQERIGVECPVKNVGSAGPEVTVLDANSKSLVSGSSTQSLGARLPQASSEPVVFRIRNIGRKNLEGIKAALSGANASDFVILSEPQASIPAIIGETTLAVQFTPSSVGMRKAVLEITSSDVDETPFRIFLQGQGLEEVATLSVEWPSGSTLADGTSRKFGSVVIGSKSTTRVISLRNNGAVALEGIQVRLSGKHKGDFTSTQAPIQLQPGESATLKVSFRPGAEGTRTATLEIRSSDPGNPVFKVPMTGLGIKK